MNMRKSIKTNGSGSESYSTRMNLGPSVKKDSYGYNKSKQTILNLDSKDISTMHENTKRNSLLDQDQLPANFDGSNNQYY